MPITRRRFLLTAAAAVAPFGASAGIARMAPRCWFGACLHGGKVRILQGYDGKGSSDAKVYSDLLSSADLQSVDRIITDLPGWGWGPLVSDGTLLIRGPGYDGSHPPSNTDDNVTGAIYASADDGMTWQLKMNTVPHEMGMMRLIGGLWHLVGGVWYQNGTLRMLTGSRRLAADMLSETIINASVWPIGHGRAGFAHMDYGGGVLMYGGIDYEGGIVYSDVLFSNDGLATITRLYTGAAPGELVSPNFFSLNGRTGLINGQRQDGTNSRQVWSTSDPADSTKWTRHADTPFEGATGSCALPITIGGVDHVMVMGGRLPTEENRIRKGIWISSDFETWKALRASEFWPD